jgi:multidrug efflux pump subunit AcrB
VLFAATLVIGLISYSRIPLQLMPEGIVEPGMWVSVFHPGASAQENEEKVARPVEEQMRTLSGIEHIDSNSSKDSVGFWISFGASMDMNLAKAEVRDSIERARGQLPDTVQEIGIYSFSMVTTSR